MIRKIGPVFVILLTITNSLKISSGIIGGKEAGRVGLTKDYKRVVHTTTEFPYSAMLEQDGQFTCGVVIVTINAVLTAAHCVFQVKYLKQLQVRAGTFTKLGEGENVQVRKVARKFVHNRYDDAGEDFDIAVLKLMENFYFDGYVKAARIPDQGWGEPYKNTEAIALGHGRVEKNKDSQTLRKVTLKVQSRRNCLLEDPTLTKMMLCAVGIEENAGTNCGDSGSPLIANHHPKKPYKDVVIGIASFNYCGPQKSSVFSSTVYLRDWIMSKL